jgi:hypothetical protein
MIATRRVAELVVLTIVLVDMNAAVYSTVAAAAAAVEVATLFPTMLQQV